MSGRLLPALYANRRLLAVPAVELCAFHYLAGFVLAAAVDFKELECEASDKDLRESIAGVEERVWVALEP